MEVVDGFITILTGKQQQQVALSTTAVVQTLLESSFTYLHLPVILSIPMLVDSILALHWDGLPDAVTSNLVALIDSLFEHFHRYAV